MEYFGTDRSARSLVLTLCYSCLPISTPVRRTRVFNGNLKRWQTSSVTSMAKMFQNSFDFTGDGLDAWDTSSVTDMSYMFRFTPSFNGDLSNWNVSKVTNMRAMFQEAIAFNSDLSNWDVSRVTDISQMVRRRNFLLHPI